VPRVGEWLGILFYVYAEDHNPPHVHAIYGDDAMLIEIATGDVLAGSLPGSKQRDALAWLETHRALATAAWARLNPEGE
jgi:hypothetical protein